MVFNSDRELKSFIKNNAVLFGGASQGICFRNREKVYKIFHDYNDEDFLMYTKDEIMKFSGIKSDMFIFPEDVIMIRDLVVGYITRYVKAHDLYSLNPLDVDLDKFMKLIKLALKEILLISRSHIVSYDMMYNLMLGDKFYVVDVLESCFSDDSVDQILKENKGAFNLEVRYFLVDGYFEYILKKNKPLNDMYRAPAGDIDIIEFIEEFRLYLSNILDKEVKSLGQARSLIKRSKGKYRRS